MCDHRFFYNVSLIDQMSGDFLSLQFKFVLKFDFFLIIIFYLSVMKCSKKISPPL